MRTARTCDQLASRLQQARQANRRQVGGRQARRRCRHCAARLAPDLWVLVRIGVGQQQRQHLCGAQAVHHDLQGWHRW